ncbi:MAG: SpoIIE family protein phosphatase [Candidatus Aminicenantes bacterium]|nr:SpoIIE family protein phosphatase [Candidatus Aminicenantes bacterium]
MSVLRVVVMIFKREKAGINNFSDNSLSVSEMRKRRISPLNDVVWRWTLYIIAGCVVVWLLRVIFGFDHVVSIWMGAFTALVTWLSAVRTLLLDSRLKKIWIVWLSLGFLIILLSPSSKGAWISALVFGIVFLLFRRYKSFRHLTSKRRAVVFVMGFLVFCLLSAGWISYSSQEIPLFQADSAVQGDIHLFADSSPAFGKTIGLNTIRYSLWCLRVFWLFSLLHLFLNIRLHFLRLKPKLAVSAVLIAFVPFLLVNLMGLIILYGTLGVNRAARAKTILQDWAHLAAEDRNFVHVVSGHSFTYETNGNNTTIEGISPPWFPQFVQTVKSDEAIYAEWTTTDKANYVWVDTDIWLIYLSSTTNPSLSALGCRLDSQMMNRLARILHTDVRLSFSNPFKLALDREHIIQLVPRKEESAEPGIAGRFIPDNPFRKEESGESPSLAGKPLYFGMTHLGVVSFDKAVIQNADVLLLTEVRLSSIIADLFSEQNPLIALIMWALLALGIILFILEAFALYFGIRITAGITSAVKALHKGTRRIAAGDFDIQIEIPNEDELGDLAVSFNEMAAAVKKGQEEAIERKHLERELATAREIQEKLLPHEMPVLAGFEITGTSLPSQQVGGDYFDFLDVGDGKLGIAIADVSGKGIPAALLMANLQASLHAQAFQRGEVAEIASRINNLLFKSTDAHMFATFFYGILDREKALFTSTNAGHNPPLLFHAEGNIEHLRAGGLILGFQPDVKYEQQTVEIHPEEVIVLYTDGITEAADPTTELVADDLFGTDRLIEVVRNNIGQSARNIQSAILGAIAKHTTNAPQFDDITLVIIKRNT